LSLIHSEYCAESHLLTAAPLHAVYCRSRSGTGGRRRTAPLRGVQHAEGSAVCRGVDGTALGPELERAQVVLTARTSNANVRSRLLRLPAPFSATDGSKSGFCAFRLACLAGTGAAPG
jgi:hypothetical protein